jgi:hypothetical protein
MPREIGSIPGMARSEALLLVTVVSLFVAVSLASPCALERNKEIITMASNDEGDHGPIPAGPAAASGAAAKFVLEPKEVVSQKALF